MKRLLTLVLIVGLAIGLSAQPIALSNAGPAPFGSFLQTEFNGSVYYLGSDGTHGLEVMKTNGTLSGTMVLKDLTPGAANSDVSHPIAAGSYLYFVHRPTGADADQLWKSDGSESGTTVLKTFPSGTELGGLIDVNGTLMFFVLGEGGQVWKSNGTNAGTEFVTDNGKNWAIYTNYFGPGAIFTHGNDLYFSVDDVIYIEDSLYEPSFGRLNRTAVYHVTPNSSMPDSLLSHHPQNAVKNFIAFNDKVYFTEGGGDFGMVFQDLWVSDGTTSGTQLLINPNINLPRVSDMEVLKGDLYVKFSTSNYNAYHHELWKVDGNNGGTSLIHASPSAGGFGFGLGEVTDMAVLGSKIIMGGFEPATGFELWRSTGTTSGTNLFMDLWPGPTLNNSAPKSFLTVGNQMFFTAETSAEGRELWRTDGFKSGTKLIKDINPGANDGVIPSFDAFDPREFNAWEFNGKLLFIGNDGQTGRELWISDGTEKGTYLIQDIAPGSSSSNVRDVNVFGNKVFFMATDGINPRKLWAYDPSDMYLRDFTLVDAQSDEDIQLLKEGDVITISGPSNSEYSIRANTVPPKVGSVRFYINNSSIRNENKAPYAISGDNPIGNYWPFTIFPGAYALSASPYSQANGGGILGVSKTINFQVVNDAARTSLQEQEFYVYPNPAHERIVLHYNNVAIGTLDVKLFDQMGRLLEVKEMEKASGPWTYRMNLEAYPQGLYTINLKMGDLELNKRFVIRK